jgi:putative PIN family toxin of toxin-antitoxin system
VFLDTNVLVSGFATQGLSATVIRLVMAEHTLLTGEVVLAELRRVLREKFGVPEARLAEVEALLRQYHVEPIPHQRPALEVRDPDDIWVLASAIQARADVLVTGDKDLLDVAHLVQMPQIISPRGFWDKAKGAASP